MTWTAHPDQPRIFTNTTFVILYTYLARCSGSHLNRQPTHISERRECNLSYSFSPRYFGLTRRLPSARGWVASAPHTTSNWKVKMQDRIQPPWDEKVVTALQRFQESSAHPYTCPTHSEQPLCPTTAGWVCNCEGCDFTQDWAHASSLEDWGASLRGAGFGNGPNGA